MARELNDIHAEIGNSYISQTDIKTAYNLSDEDVSKGYLNLFSKVSISRLLFYAVAYCIYVFERILDVFKAETQTTVDAAFVSNQPWWHAKALEFQRGYNLLLNRQTFVYYYNTYDASSLIIKRIAVREIMTAQQVCKVQLLVATEGENGIEPLSPVDKSLLEIYANTIKPSGVLVEVITGNSDVVDFDLTVNFNPLIMNTAGELIIDSSKPVEIAINDFIGNLNNENFGGKLNLTHLIDAIQDVPGVVDPKITEFKINGNTQAENWGTYASENGWFSVGNLTITYQPQGDL